MVRVGKIEFEHGLMAIHPGGAGDVAKSKVAWKQKRYIPEVSSPLYHEGLVYISRDGGVVTCLDAATGNVHYTSRLGSAGMYFASPSAGDGKIYIASYNGVVSVLRAGKEYRLLSQQDFGERIMASPALAGGRVYLRTEEALYALGN
jgi:outer membrane protein assembly factor BamB